ncbi:MAG: transcriptional regulator, partial [Bacteroidota bacterium]
FEESLALGRAIQNKVRISESLDNIGEAEMELGRYEESLKHLTESYEISKSLDDVLRQAETLNHIARALIFLKRYAESEYNLLEARKLIDVSTSNTKKEMLLDNALIGSTLYAALNDYQQSLSYFKQYNELRNEILSEAKKNGLAQMRIAYETQKKEEEIELLEKEKELKVLQRNALGGAVILLAVIGYLVYSRQRNIRVKEKQLAEVREALMKKELERETLEKEVLNSKLEHKNSEMTHFALHISQRNDLLRSFLEELTGVQSTAPPEVASKLGKVVHQFGHIQEINKDAENFHLNVEAEYKEFFFNLTQSFPDLTGNEKRLCAQVRLNLSIKDIASLNNVSVKSVEMARYRLRKRFNLDHDENLADWLKKF